MRKLGTFLIVVGCLGVAFLIFLMFSAKSGPSGTAVDFMDALGTRDVDRLVRLTYAPNQSPEQIRKNWDFSMEAGKSYRFTFKLGTVTETGPDTASAKVLVSHFTNSPSPTDDTYDLGMVKEKGAWKVEVTSLNRDLYPGLPRN